jgi:fatty acid desaturase
MMRQASKSIGYRPPKYLKPLTRSQCKTAVGISILTCLSDLAIITVMGYCGWIAWSTFPPWSALALCLFGLWPILARSLRGLENMVHEASHFNFSSKRALNDALGNTLAAYWLFQTVNLFRIPHMIHHSSYGLANDPDRTRYDALNLHSIERGSMLRFFLQVCKRMPKYLAGWHGQFYKHPMLLIGCVAWHLGATTVVSLLLPQIWFIWGCGFWIPFIFYLPFLRFLAETEKHDYASGNNEFRGTNSNLGFVQRLILHPHGDAYHLLHHVAPSVPHWKMASTHRLYMILDPQFRTGHIRHSVFESLANTEHKRSIKGQREHST